MRFSEALLRKVKQCDLTAYIQSVVPDLKFEPHGNYYTARCPHPDHNDEHPSFRVWHNGDGTWSFACMACHSGQKDLESKPGQRNYGTDIIAFIQWMSDYKGSEHIYTFEEAVTKALNFFHIPCPVTHEPVISEQELHRRKQAALYNLYLTDYESEAKRYAERRGLGPTDIKTWQIGSNGDRLIFPLYDVHNSLKGFISRTICNEDPKYIHSSAREGFVKSEFLYGLNKLDRSVHTAYITEGVFDVITAYRYGLRNIFACLGTAFGETHARLLSKYGIREIIFVFDGDDAGQKALKNAVRHTRAAGLSTGLVVLPSGEDLDSFCRFHRFRSCQKLEEMKQYDYEYELKSQLQAYQEQRNTLQNRCLPAILSKAAEIKDPKEYDIFRMYILNQFDIKLEPKNVRETETNLAHPVSA